MSNDVVDRAAAIQAHDCAWQGDDEPCPCCERAIDAIKALPPAPRAEGWTSREELAQAILDDPRFARNVHEVNQAAAAVIAADIALSRAGKGTGVVVAEGMLDEDLTDGIRVGVWEVGEPHDEVDPLVSFDVIKGWMRDLYGEHVEVIVRPIARRKGRK